MLTWTPDQSGLGRPVPQTRVRNGVTLEERGRECHI